MQRRLILHTPMVLPETWPEAEKDRQNESRADPPQCFDTQDLSEDTTDSRDTLL